MGFLIMLPIVQCLLFNVTVGHDPKGLHIAIVNDEVENGLMDCAKVPTHGCHINLPLSCRYLNVLTEKELNLVCYDICTVSCYFNLFAFFSYTTFYRLSKAIAKNQL